MLQEINDSLTTYFVEWAKVADGTSMVDAEINAVGWKVADATEYAKVYNQLRTECDVVVETWMNGRWIAKMHLKDTTLDNGITIIKLMQRRPGSDDALGLDHVDFICKDMLATAKELESTQVNWSWETNDVVDDYRWISVWFANTEAKVKDFGVVDTVIKELQDLR